MATGYQLGGICYQTLHQMGARACADATGLVSGGHQSCKEYVPTGTHSVSLHMVVSSSGNMQIYQSDVFAQPCEYPTFSDTYAPLLAAALPVFALIFIGRRFFEIFRENNNV